MIAKKKKGKKKKKKKVLEKIKIIDKNFLI